MKNRAFFDVTAGAPSPHPRAGGRLRLVVFLLCAALLAGCVARTEDRRPDPQPTLSVGLAPPTPTSQNELLMLLTTEGLVHSTPRGEHEPRLADGWVIRDAPDGRPVVTVRLRPGISFHDGSRLTATVVKEFLDAARTDTRQLQLHPALADIDRITVQAVDRFDIRLHRPSALLLDALAIRLQRQTKDGLVGTGPFALDTQTENTLRLVANRDYYLGRPSIDIVSVRHYPTLRTAWAAMMRDEIDVLFEVPASGREFIAAESRVELYATPRRYAFALAFNLGRPTLRDVRVRRALNQAVDRREVIARALAGDGRPASGVWAPHWAYDGLERVYRHHPQLADELLTQAGYPPVASPGPDPTDRMPARLRFSAIVLDTGPLETIALVVQRQLHELGVEMSLELIAGRDIQTRLDRGDWDAAFVQLNTGRTLSRLYNLWHSSEPLDVFGYESADDLLDSLRYAANRAELAHAATGFQQRIYEDPPAVFIAEDSGLRAVSRRIAIPPVQPGQDVMETPIWRWRAAAAGD